jgi:pilus assembly protein FimV
MLYSGMVPALGLGDISLGSALNQPLEAEIELLDVAGMTPEDFKVRLASAEVFASAGVERPYFLSDLRFTPRIDGSRGVIRVVSNKPVREPYLNFVIEITRPNGSLVREYTLLIDPPELMPLTQSPVGALRPLASAPQLELPVVQALPDARLGERYTVVRGDSLWRIAQRLQETNAGSSILPIMADLHALNPQAFVGGDINRLIVGASMLIPDRFADPAVPNAAAGSPEPATVTESLPVPAPAPEIPSDVQLAQQRADEAFLIAEQERQQLQQQMEELQTRIENMQQQVERKDVQLDEMVSRLQAQADAEAETWAQEVAAAATAAAAVAAPPVVQESYAPQGFWAWLVGVAGGGILLGWFAAVVLGRRHERVAEQGGETDFKTWLADQQAPQASEPKPADASVAAQSPENQGALMNLDDFSPDASWDALSPFGNKVVPKRAANQELEGFASNLLKMPEVFDLSELSSQVEGGETGSKENLDRLNQALAFIQQGQIESACIILNNVLDEGDDLQKQEAREILSRIA